MLKLLKPLVPALLLSASLAHAAPEQPADPDRSDDNLYVGIGLFTDMPNVNVEVVTRWGNFMVRAGQFSDNEGLAGNLSWRRHLEGDRGDEDGHDTGFYAGLFAGQVVGEAIDGNTVLRLGGGGEIGYHWVSDYTRSEITVGLGAAEPVEGRTVKYEAEPMAFFSVNIALGY